ncbi:hypothetical protein GCM10022245_35980 [Streptomyces mayteni]
MNGAPHSRPRLNAGQPRPAPGEWRRAHGPGATVGAAAALAAQGIARARAAKRPASPTPANGGRARPAGQRPAAPSQPTPPHTSPRRAATSAHPDRQAARPRLGTRTDEAPDHPHHRSPEKGGWVGKTPPPYVSAATRSR